MDQKEGLLSGWKMTTEGVKPGGDACVSVEPSGCCPPSYVITRQHICALCIWPFQDTWSLCNNAMHNWQKLGVFLWSVCRALLSASALLGAASLLCVGPSGCGHVYRLLPVDRRRVCRVGLHLP